MKKIPPVHPGEILFEEFLKPMGISQNQDDAWGSSNPDSVKAGRSFGKRKGQTNLLSEAE